jgi:hypothetical protein
VRGQGAVSQKLQASAATDASDHRRQFQHPAFSLTGRYVAFFELLFKADDTISPAAKLNALAEGQGTQGKSSGVKMPRPLRPDTGGAGGTQPSRTHSTYVGSEAIVFEVPRDPSNYGEVECMPQYRSGSLPGAPFFLQFSPDERQLVALCSSPGGSGATSLVALEWRNRTINHHANTKRIAHRPSLASHASRDVRRLLKGNDLFFTFTTSSRGNATIVAHCQRTDGAHGESPQKAVWMLQQGDVQLEAGGAPTWTQINDGDAHTRWTTPMCHSAGGGDSVLLVDDGWVVSRALSRWKRGADGAPHVKRLKQVQGQVQFLVSRDSSKVSPATDLILDLIERFVI